MKREPLVKLMNIQKSFGRVYALEEINLELYPGEIVSLVGDNGAGKSTLTKIIAGTEKPDAGGQIFFDGVEVKLECSQSEISWHRDSSPKSGTERTTEHLRQCLPWSRTN